MAFSSSVRAWQQEVLQQVQVVPLVVLQPLGVLHNLSMMAKDLLMVVACRQTAQSFLPHQTMPQYLVALDEPILHEQGRPLLCDQRATSCAQLLLVGIGGHIALSRDTPGPIDPFPCRCDSGPGQRAPCLPQSR